MMEKVTEWIKSDSEIDKNINAPALRFKPIITKNKKTNELLAILAYISINNHDKYFNEYKKYLVKNNIFKVVDDFFADTKSEIYIDDYAFLDFNTIIISIYYGLLIFKPEDLEIRANIINEFKDCIINHEAYDEDETVVIMHLITYYLEFLKESIELFKDNILFNTELTQLLFDVGEYDESLKYCKEAKKYLNDKDALKTINNLITNIENKEQETIDEILDLISLNKTNKAYSKATELVKKIPESQAALFILALVHRKMEEYNKAIEILLSPKINKEDNPIVYLELAKNYNALKDIDMAKEMLSIVLDLDFYNIDALRSLCVIYLNEGKLDEAAHLIYQIHSIDPTSVILEDLNESYKSLNGEKLDLKNIDEYKNSKFHHHDH